MTSDYEHNAFFVERGDVRLHVEVEGKPGAALILLVHGYPDDKKVWQSLVKHLSAQYRVARYDVRGAGESSAPRGRKAYKMKELAADLFAVADAISPEKAVHLVGHDWGGIQAWEAVCDSRGPSRFASFTSVSGPNLDYVGDQSRQNFSSGSPAQLRAALKQLGNSWYIFLFQLPLLPEALWRRYTAWIEERASGAEDIDTDAFHDPQRRLNGVQGIALYRANMLPRMLNPKPRSCDVPLQVIVPTEDPYVSPHVAYSAASWAEEARFVEVRGGHWFFLKAPQRLAELLAGFVEEIDARDA